MDGFLLARSQLCGEYPDLINNNRVDYKRVDRSSEPYGVAVAEVEGDGKPATVVSEVKAGGVEGGAAAAAGEEDPNAELKAGAGGEGRRSEEQDAGGGEQAEEASGGGRRGYSGVAGPGVGETDRCEGRVEERGQVVEHEGEGAGGRLIEKGGEGSGGGGGNRKGEPGRAETHNTASERRPSGAAVGFYSAP